MNHGNGGTRVLPLMPQEQALIYRSIVIGIVWAAWRRRQERIPYGAGKILDVLSGHRLKAVTLLNKLAIFYLYFQKNEPG